MKVICIDENAWPEDYPMDSHDQVVQIGSEYNVTNVKLEDGYIWYELEEDPGWDYWEKAFARTQDVNSIALVKQFQEQ